MRWAPLLWSTGGVLFASLAGGFVLGGLNPPPMPPLWQVPGGDAAQGKMAISRYGCGSCHTIQGVDTAKGRVGPELVDYRRQGFVAGRLPNTPHDLANWIKDPQKYLPGTVMPTLGVTDSDARNIAAYLYSTK
jgi:cytochrome c